MFGACDNTRGGNRKWPVVAMSFLARDNLIGVMITGRKKNMRFPKANGAASPARVAVPLAARVVARFAYAVTQIDPQAYTPGAHGEAGEGGEGGKAGEIDAD